MALNGIIFSCTQLDNRFNFEMLIVEWKSEPSLQFQLLKNREKRRISHLKYLCDFINTFHFISFLSLVWICVDALSWFSFSFPVNSTKTIWIHHAIIVYSELLRSFFLCHGSKYLQSIRSNVSKASKILFAETFGILWHLFDHHFRTNNHRFGIGIGLNNDRATRKRKSLTIYGHCNRNHCLH